MIWKQTIWCQSLGVDSCEEWSGVITKNYSANSLDQTSGHPQHQQDSAGEARRPQFDEEVGKWVMDSSLTTDGSC